MSGSSSSSKKDTTAPQGKPVLAPPKGLLYTLRMPLSILAIVGILCSWVIGFLVMAVLYVILYPFVKASTRRTVVGTVFRFFSGLFAFVLNPLWSCKRVNALPTVPAGTIIMSNHLSNADPWVTCWSLLPYESKYVAKSSLFSLPFGGWAMRMAGDLPIYFTKAKGGWGTKKGSVGKMMAQAKSLLTGGENILAFPEGVRSYDGSMSPFKAGMFMLAIETGAPVLPMAISGSQAMWPRGDWKMSPGTAHVKFGTLIETKSGKYTVETLMAEVRRQMLEMKETLPATSSKKDE